jgi:hypothetical protein
VTHATLLANPQFQIWPTQRRSIIPDSSYWYDMGSALLFLFLGLGIILVAMLIVRQISDRRHDAASAQACALFRRMLHKMGVGWIMRAVLSHAARASGLAHPTAMLLSKELYARHAIAWADQITLHSLRGPLHRRIEALATVFFPPAPAPSPQSP